ncbi:MAG TPA: PQQ-binding-like beta-propeller repeat protein [Planctomycetota bacterium]|nr:PQQ-binding-like beta-propeller repeat protein [Planctomycetota bacterium]
MLMRLIALGLGLAALAFGAPAVPSREDREAFWPHWRGPAGNGVAPKADPPLRWSETENVRWKRELPGLGHSTPILWRDRVFITAAMPFGDPLPPTAGARDGEHDNRETVRRQKFLVLAVHRDDGRILWQRTVREGVPHETGHETGSYASHSPVTDGERVYASFGSNGLFCLDWEGRPVWEKDLGQMHSLHAHGEGSSPALHGDTLVVNWDHEGSSFVIALDSATGREKWRTPREEITSWSTPLVVTEGGKAQVIISATRRIRGYDLATGRVLWECGGLSHNVVASPVAGGGLVIAGSSYEKKAMLAIRLEGAQGDLTGTDHVIWTRDRHTPYVPSPLLYEDKLYFFSHYQGILMCLNARTGEAYFGPARLPEVSDFYASPLGAAGRVYLASREGVTLVLKHGPALEVLATNRLQDRFSASPAAAGGQLFLRGERFLYCISTP